jgi:tetratricopeptide (TPR) repeat protein
LVWSENPEMKSLLAYVYKFENELHLNFHVNPEVLNAYPKEFQQNPMPLWFYLNLNKNEVPDSLYGIPANIQQAFLEHDFAKAKELALKIDSDFPGNSYTLAILGEIAKKKYEYEKAYQYFKKAIAVNPMNDLAYLGLVRTCDNLGREKEIRENILKGLSLNFHFQKTQRQLKYILRKNGWKIRPKWFVPHWRKKADGEYEVSSELWEKFIIALKGFQTLSDNELTRLTGISNRSLAVYFAAIQVLLHYAEIQHVQDPVVQKIKKIKNERLLIPFITNEIFIYFPEFYSKTTGVNIEKYEKYFQKYYLLD